MKPRFRPVLVIGLMLVGTISLTGCVPSIWSRGPSAPSAPSASSTATPTPTPTPSGEPVECKALYVQYPNTHEENRVIPNFADKYAAALLGVTDEKQQKARLNLLLLEASHDAQVLAIWAFAADLYEDPADWKELVTDNCLSSEGQELYFQFKGAMSAKGTTIEEALAPVDGVNSGISDDVYGVNEYQGVTGDLTAIKITLPDGTVIWIMVRCGNVVYPGTPPGLLPKVPTDDAGANPNIGGFYQDGMGDQTISWGNGAIVKNGYQGTLTDTYVAQQQATTGAAAGNQSNTNSQAQAQEDANTTGAGTVNTNQGHTASAPPPGGPVWSN